MLYLVKVCHEVFTYYKVGTTIDIDQRFSQYQAHAPECELIKTRPGDVFEENIVNKYLHTFPTGYWEYYKDEWFRCAPGDTTIESFFSRDLEEMKKVIWENRKKVLSSTSRLDVELWNIINGGAQVTKTIQDSNGNLILNPNWDFDKNFYTKTKTKTTGSTSIGGKITDPKLKNLVQTMESASRLDSKFKLYCKIREDLKSDKDKTSELLSCYGNSDMENLYSHFGIDKCRAVSYQFINLKRMLADESNEDPLRAEILGTFKINKKYTLKEIKKTLGEIYDRLGILSKTPKASDIRKYFNTKQASFYDKVTGKRDNGFKLTSIK